ncbi:MAG: DNA-3-methyladenine glycosylase 2 family protein [Ignavibacteria bacterium]
MVNIVNPKDVESLINEDRIFSQIHTQYGSPPNWSRPPGFIALSKIILGQQVSLESADAHFRKINNYLPSFTPDEIIRLSDTEMRNCHISRQKAAYLRSLSTAILEGKLNLDQLSKKLIPDVREQLKSVKGIGDWTADIYLMFCMQAKDIFPAGDIAVINTIKELSRHSTKERIIKRSERWKPFRSLAAFFLWHYYLNKRKRKFEIV